MDAKNVVADVWANLDNSAYAWKQSRDLSERRTKIYTMSKSKFKNMNQEPEMKGYFCKCGNIYWRTKASQCRDCEEEADDSAAKSNSHFSGRA